MDYNAIIGSVLSSTNVFPKTTHHILLSEIYFICILILNRVFRIITLYEPRGKDMRQAVPLLDPFIPLRKKTKARRNWLPCLYLQVFFSGRAGAGTQAFWLLVQCSSHHLSLMEDLCAQPGLVVVPWLTQVKGTEAAILGPSGNKLD